MEMRRYRMKARREVQLKRLLRSDRISVKKIEIAAHEKREDTAYVFFENVEEEVVKDKIALEQLKAKAEEVAKDEVYKKLSNSKQRELYLLDRYGLSKREGVDVIELVKIAEVVAAEQEIVESFSAKKAKEKKGDE